MRFTTRKWHNPHTCKNKYAELNIQVRNSKLERGAQNSDTILFMLWPLVKVTGHPTTVRTAMGKRLRLFFAMFSTSARIDGWNMRNVDLRCHSIGYLPIIHESSFDFAQTRNDLNKVHDINITNMLNACPVSTLHSLQLSMGKCVSIRCHWKKRKKTKSICNCWMVDN